MLPPDDMVTLLFLRKIWSGEKMLLRDTEVVTACMTRLKEFNAKINLQFVT